MGSNKNRQMNGPMDRQIYRQTGRQMGRQTDRQTDRQTKTLQGQRDVKMHQENYKEKQNV